MREIYDVITKKTIFIKYRQLMKIAKLLNVDYTLFSSLFSKRVIHVHGRYILPENKNKIFILVDLDSGQEYDCITNKSIYIYFNLPVNQNEIKYINKIKENKQHLVSICRKVFYLKSHGIVIATSNLKNSSIKINEYKYNIKVRRKIYNRLLNRIHSALKTKNQKKLNRTEELIGCKVSFIIGYLEAKFSKGMSWKNHGKWHVDHIIPCSKFDLSKIEEQHKCFHYSNLQPLWATTEIAVEFGESPSYIGNLNKNDYYNSNHSKYIL